MDLSGFEAGPDVGDAKAFLLDQVLEGNLAPGDTEGALTLLNFYLQRKRS